MTGVLDQLTQRIFQKDNLRDVSVDELESYIQQYPYFTGPRLLLARKKFEENADSADPVLSSASLYIHQPALLEFLIEEEARELDLLPNTAVEPVPEPEAPENKGLRQLLEREIEISEKETELVFTPQFTIDYFASQGIQNRSEDQKNDRFSLQLRSFTEWLKTLKKIGPEGEQAPPPSHPDLEEKVTHLATGSLAEQDIVTEAMAEVWLKQGDTEKARAIYRKLSLLNPSKSSYFASLIEKINDSK